MSRLFNSKKAKDKVKEKAPWRHKFMCLGYTDQTKIPTTEFQKDELEDAGLGEKELCLDLDLSQEGFRDAILEVFPRLEAGGGFRFLKGLYW